MVVNTKLMLKKLIQIVFDKGMCDSYNSIPQSEAQCKKVVSENIKSRLSQFVFTYNLFTLR